MKRSIAIIVAVVFMFVVMSPLAGFAAESELTFSISGSISATRGGDFTVPINVGSNTDLGFAAVGLVLGYDPEVLDIAGVTGVGASIPIFNLALGAVPGEQWIWFVNRTPAGVPENWIGNGTVAIVTFIVKSNAPLGASSVTLGFTPEPNGAPADSNGELLAGAVASGSVEITVDSGGGGGSWNGGGSYVTPNPSPNPGPSPTTTPTPTTTPPPTPSTTPTPPPAATPNYPDYPQVGGDSTGGADSGEPPPGGFIGNIPDASDSAGARPSASNNASGFGSVPQTGAADTMVIAAALCASLSITAGLWVCVLRYKRNR